MENLEQIEIRVQQMEEYAGMVNCLLLRENDLLRGCLKDAIVRLIEYEGWLSYEHGLAHSANPAIKAAKIHLEGIK